MPEYTQLRTFHKRVTAVALLLFTFLLVGGCAGKKRVGEDSPQAPLQELLSDAVRTLDRMTVADDVPSFVPYLKDAKGIIIFPAVYKGGWLLGVEVGKGVLLSHTREGWSQPVFVETGQASVGLQAGGQQSEIILVLMSETYVQEIVQGNKLQASADFSVAAGPVGHNNKINYDTHVEGIIYFGRTKGLMFDASVGGGGISAAAGMNGDYYGPDSTPDSIITGRSSSEGTAPLRNRLAFYTEQSKQY